MSSLQRFRAKTGTKLANPELDVWIITGDCKAGTGRVLQAWQTDRAGASKDMGSVDGDYAPIEEDTIVGQIMAVACGEPTPYFVPITGDVLAAADAALAVAR